MEGGGGTVPLCHMVTGGAAQGREMGGGQLRQPVVQPALQVVGLRGVRQEGRDESGCV